MPPNIVEVPTITPVDEVVDVLDRTTFKYSVRRWNGPAIVQAHPSENHHLSGWYMQAGVARVNGYLHFADPSNSKCDVRVVSEIFRPGVGYGRGLVIGCMGASLQINRKMNGFAINNRVGDVDEFRSHIAEIFGLSSGRCLNIGMPGTDYVDGDGNHRYVIDHGLPSVGWFDRDAVEAIVSAYNPSVIRA